MPLFLNSGALQSRAVSSGDLISGEIYVGHVGSGAITSGIITQNALPIVMSGHIASGAGGSKLERYYRQIGTLGAFGSFGGWAHSGFDVTRGYPAGQNNCALGIGTTFSPSQTMRVFCMPFATSRALSAWKVAVWKTQNGNDGRLCQMGIYDAGSDLWPTTLLYSTSQLRMSGQSTYPDPIYGRTEESGLTWSFAPNKLYWAAWLQGSGAVIGLKGVFAPLQFWGVDANMIPTNIAMISYRGVSGTWPLPDPFPTTSGTLEGTAASVPDVQFYF